MAYSLRLPAALDVDARSRCERLGISLNALICVALDAYLRGPESLSKAEIVAPSRQSADSAGGVELENSHKVEHPINPGPTGIEPDGAVRSKAERREFTRQQRRDRKAQR